MRASKHKCETPVGDPVRSVRGLFQFGVDQNEGFRPAIGAAPPAGGVDQPPSRRCREPSFRVHGNALAWPDGERGGESLGKRISELKLGNGKHLEAGKHYKVAGWASVNQQQGRPVWDVLAKHLRSGNTLAQRGGITLKGVADNLAANLEARYHARGLARVKDRSDAPLSDARLRSAL